MSYFANLGNGLAYSIVSLWNSLIAFVPSFIIAVLIFIIGWALGSIVGRAIDQVISALKIDKAISSTGAGSTMQKSGMHLTVGKLIGGIVKWFIIIAFLVESLTLLNLTVVTDILKTDVLGYLPNVIEAALILIAATIVSDFMGKVVTASAKSGNVRSANFLGTLTRYAIWIFAFIIALGVLGIAAVYMQYLFIGLVSMLAIAGGLAFGLGGKEAAARSIEHLRDRVKPMN